MEFFATVAQVVPVLWLITVVETRAVSDRSVRSWTSRAKRRVGHWGGLTAWVAAMSGLMLGAAGDISSAADPRDSERVLIGLLLLIIPCLAAAVASAVSDLGSLLRELHGRL